METLQAWEGIVGFLPQKRWLRTNPDTLYSVRGSCPSADTGREVVLKAMPPNTSHTRSWNGDLQDNIAIALKGMPEFVGGQKSNANWHEAVHLLPKHDSILKSPWCFDGLSWEGFSRNMMGNSFKPIFLWILEEILDLGGDIHSKMQILDWELSNQHLHYNVQGSVLGSFHLKAFWPNSPHLPHTDKSRSLFESHMDS